MKKKLVYISMLLLMTTSCSTFNFSTISESISKVNIFNSETDSFKDKLASYKLEAKIITSKGDINIFLYPESAPETVANFVYLSKKNFYDNMTFHRVVSNAIIQAGDSKGDSTGTAGYYIKDEFDSWIKFDEAGILAMANAKDNGTASSQFFITLFQNSAYNGKYTAFGTLVSKDDMNVARSIKVGDVIKDIEIRGHNVNDFLNNFKEQTQKWDKLYKKGE